MPDIVRAYTYGLQMCLGIVEALYVRSMLICLDIVLSVRTRGKVNSCNDIHRTYSMLILRHCQSAARHIQLHHTAGIAHAYLDYKNP